MLYYIGYVDVLKLLSRLDFCRVMCHNSTSHIRPWFHFVAFHLHSFSSHTFLTLTSVQLKLKIYVHTVMSIIVIRLHQRRCVGILSILWFLHSRPPNLMKQLRHRISISGRYVYVVGFVVMFSWILHMRCGYCSEIFCPCCSLIVGAHTRTHTSHIQTFILEGQAHR